MPRPKTKTELLELSQKNYDQLNRLIDALSAEEQIKPFPRGTMNRNIRDVLAHLHHWHLLFLDWYQAGMKGEKPAMPAAGYSWKTTPQLNQKIWEDYQKVDLEEIRTRFSKSHTQVFRLIKKHTHEELFEKKQYHWTGTTSLGAYLVSATSSHYDWGFKLIKKAKKNVA